MKFSFRKDKDKWKSDNPRFDDAILRDAWNNAPKDLQDRAIHILRTNLSEEELTEIREAVEKYGSEEWINHPPFETWVEIDSIIDGEPGIRIPSPYHFARGMGIRNILRCPEKGTGIRDAELPALDAYYGPGTDARNWDDYYIQALEAAAKAS